MLKLVPNLILDSVLQITPELLKKNDIKAIILDVDNTLTKHGSQDLSEEIKNWLEGLKKDNILLMIVSNNTDKRIKPFANKIGIEYIAMGLKPMTRGFAAAKEKFKLPCESIMVVGDQIFTDIWGGNRLSMFTVLVTPISMSESLMVKIKRRFEKGAIKRYYAGKGH